MRKREIVVVAAIVAAMCGASRPASAQSEEHPPMQGTPILAMGPFGKIIEKVQAVNGAIQRVSGHPVAVQTGTTHTGTKVFGNQDEPNAPIPFFQAGYDHTFLHYGVHSTGAIDGRYGHAGYDASGEVAWSAQAQGQASFGADGNHVEAAGSAGVFTGVKASGQVSGTVQICGIEITMIGQGEASAGIGASASGHVSFDWSTMTLKVGGSVSGTLGLGAGAGGEVDISLAGIMQHPGDAIGCVFDGLKKLAGYALKAGEALVTAAWDVGKGAVKALDKGVKAVAKVVTGAAKKVASAIGGLFHHKKKAPPAPTPKSVAKVQPNDTHGVNVARGAITVPNDANGWGYGPGAYGVLGSEGQSGAARTGASADAPARTRGWIAK